MFDENERLLMNVRRSANRMYKLNIENRKSVCLLSKLDEVTKLWHLRLGHANYQAMELISCDVPLLPLIIALYISHLFL